MNQAIDYVSTIIQLSTGGYTIYLIILMQKKILSSEDVLNMKGLDNLKNGRDGTILTIQLHGHNSKNGGK